MTTLTLDELTLHHYAETDYYDLDFDSNLFCSSSDEDEDDNNKERSSNSTWSVLSDEWTTSTADLVGRCRRDTSSSLVGNDYCWQEIAYDSVLSWRQQRQHPSNKDKIFRTPNSARLSLYMSDDDAENLKDRAKPCDDLSAVTSMETDTSMEIISATPCDGKPPPTRHRRRWTHQLFACLGRLVVFHPFKGKAHTQRRHDAVGH